MSAGVGSLAIRRRLQQLGRSPPFREFPFEALRELAAAGSDRTVPRGTVLFQEADHVGAVYVLDRGAVRIASTTVEGRVVVFRLAGPGETFGLSSVLRGGDRSATACAITDSRVVLVPAGAVLRMLDRNPAAARTCAAYLAARLERERLRLLRAATGDIRVRLADVLRDLGGTHGIVTGAGVLIDVPLRHEDLAGLVGTTRETVTRAMAVLAARGFLRRVGSRYLVSTEPHMASPPVA